MNEYSYLLTFNTSLGKSKQLRVKDADTSIEPQAFEKALFDIISADVYHPAKVGTLESIESKFLVCTERVTLI